jgi:hypothetical protein
MLTKVRNFLHQPQRQPEVDTAAIEWAHQCALTPDNWKLEQYIRQLVFLPCDLKAGGVNHDIIKDVINGPVYEDMVYTSKKYTFWKKDLGGHSFPIALPGDYRPNAFTTFPVEPAPIKGSLYFVPGSFMKELDKHRQNGVQFRRERVDVRISYRTVSFDPPSIDEATLLPQLKRRPLPQLHDGFTTVPAWMYFGVVEYWDNMIGGIFKSQMNTFQHQPKRVWIDKFYKFPDDDG